MPCISRFVLGVAAVATVAAVAATGCVGSVNHFVDDGDARFEPGLLGTWFDSSSHERVVITRGGALDYAIRYTDDKGETVSLEGVLGRSRGGYVLDVQPGATALGPYEGLVVRLHIAIVLDSLGARVHASILEPDSIDHYLKSHPRAVPHVTVQDGLALTGSSAEVAAFLAEYLQRPGVLAAPSTWTRVPGAER